MYGAGGYGEQNTAVGKGQKDDNNAYAVHELYGKAADLRIFHCGVFSGIQRFDYGRIIFSWNINGDYYRTYRKGDSV